MIFPIVIYIDANERNCGKCRWIDVDNDMGARRLFCMHFRQETDLEPEGASWHSPTIRWPECIAAEAAAKK